MIREVIESDHDQIVKLFCENIRHESSYISHGEIQMGIAVDSENLANSFEAKWAEYLTSQMKEFRETILVYEHNKRIEGFIIGEIDQDRDKEFGVICDLVVSEQFRNKGAGSGLLDTLLKIYKKKGITDFYLESGINNHSAHNFFEKRGFKKISSIFRLESK